MRKISLLVLLSLIFGLLTLTTGAALAGPGGRPTPPTTTTTLPAPTGDAYDFMVSVSETRNAWVAPYFRTLPYMANVGWTDGDRVAYRCAYGFLMRGDRVVGRVTFTRIHEAASYSALNDRGMEEGVRHYNGALDTENLAQLNECPAPSESYTPTGNAEKPIVTYRTSRGQLLEVRDYTKLIVDPRITFETVLVNAARVTVVASFEGVPFFVVYYDSLGGTVMGSDR